MRYRVLAPLGRGAMGVVYRAEHIHLRQQVALKVLAPEYGKPELEARFEREARTAARLDHRGCVRVLDYGCTVDRMRFIAMELLEGPTLDQLLRREGPLAPARAMWAASEVLKALKHAHAQGVLHRDVKPANIMARRGDAQARLVLIDFGLARLRDEGPLTAAGVCWGSPSYVAPERLQCRPIDARADLYSVGVLLYELLAGVRPFQGRTPAETARLHLVGPPRPLRAVRPEVSPALDAVVVRALAKDPDRRFPDAAAMLDALADVPAADRRAAAAAAARATAADASSTMINIPIFEPSWPRRLWSRLRYGSWRWRTA